MLPHDYLMCSGRASRIYHNVVDMHNQFCSEHNVDTNTCICLGFHGDEVPYAKGIHKQVSTFVLLDLCVSSMANMYLLCNLHKEYV